MNTASANWFAPPSNARPDRHEHRLRAMGVPDAVLSDRSDVSVAFVRVLRSSGVDVPVGATVTFATALALTGVSDRDRVYWTGRATLLRRPEDTSVYDAVFSVFWEALQHDGLELVTAPATPVAIALEDDSDDGDGDDSGDDDSQDDADDGAEVPVISIRWSRDDVLRHRDFASYSETEYAEAAEIMSRMRMASSSQRSRRHRRSHSARRGRPDVARTVRHSLRTDGEPINRYYRERSERPRRIVLILDVSGSMEPYARAFVRFVHASVLSRKRVEVFALGTRLTRITRELQSRDPDAAIRAAALRVVDWSGGTRLGEGMRTFNDEWGVRGMARNADVVILSDGWDRGEPELLGAEMARLQRIAHRVIWVNPLKASEGYAPLARGMAAALPYVDGFIEGHSLAALKNLTDLIGAQP